LDSHTEIKTVAGDNPQNKQKFKRKKQFIFALKNEGIQSNSIKIYCRHLKHLVKNGAELYDPESVKATIAERKCGNATKNLSVAAYSKYLEVFDGTWKPPKYRSERKLPYVPTEKEIDCLINASHKRLSCYLYLLKQTGLRSMEAWCLEWKDVDFTRNTITLNNTLKHGTPRMFKVNSRLIAMLNNLQKKSEKYIFVENPNRQNLNYFSVTFRHTRKKLAIKMQNPNLNRISFHTFRHWFATTLYQKTKSLPYVQERLGHKSLLTTTLYTHLVNFETDNYHSATAQTLDEAKKLVEAGFEYVTDMEDVKLFRKPKF
jgi:integrase